MIFSKVHSSSLDIIDQRNWMIGWERAVQMTVGDFPEHLLVAVHFSIVSESPFTILNNSLQTLISTFTMKLF